jgi:hypothetical protein
MPVKRARKRSLIELRLGSVDQLFDPFDPFPIPTRDLAKSAEEFIVGWARDLPGDSELAIRFYLPEDAAAEVNAEDLAGAISAHFRYRADRKRGDMREQFTIARMSLVVGLAVLGACMGLRQVLRDFLPEGALAGFFAEGLVILGWVANWRPIEILLYDWWPLGRVRRLFLRLSECPVEVRAIGVTSSED